MGTGPVIVMTPRDRIREGVRQQRSHVVHLRQVTGDVDYELLVACPAIPDLDGALSCLRRCGGIEVTSVGLVLREVSGPAAAGLTGHLVAATRDGRPHGGR